MVNKDSALKSWYSLQREIQAFGATSPSKSSLNFSGGRPKQINDSVYEVFNPSERPCIGPPSIELVFFHGLQLEGSKEAHLTTWLSQDGSELWVKWIWENHPKARILLISYDAFARRTDMQGHMDRYQVCENLKQDLTMGEAHVGQAGCPVALVGHCIGGLMMKELCIALDSTAGKLQCYEPNNREQNLFLNTTGLFFYGCPHHGSRFADVSKEKGELLKEVTTLNNLAERRNEDFRKLRIERKWKTYGIEETLPTKLGPFHGLVVPEGSARADVDAFYSDGNADHLTVSRPKSKSSSRFILLLEFIGRILKEDKMRRIRQIHIPPIAVGLEARLKTLQEDLQGVKRLAIVGMPGIGKSTLAKKAYNTLWSSYDYTCFLSNVKKLMGDREDPIYLQREIVRNLYYKGMEVHKSCTWESLNGRKVLLVLVNVDLQSHVSRAIDSCFSHGSHVIVTSLKTKFLMQEDFKCHRVKDLQLEDSKRLFCHHAFGKEDAPDLYKERVAQIIEVLEGLPSGLVVTGEFLKGRERLVLWDDVLKRLKLAKSLDGRRHNPLWSDMRTVYEELEEVEKQMFLDIATCFHGECFEDVKQAWRHCGWADTADLGWANLIDNNLVTVEKTNKSSEVIRMHQVLRTVGRSEACPESNDVTTCRRVRYDMSNPLPTTWPFSEETTEVKILMISYRTVEKAGYPNIQVQELRGLKELRVLWLDGVSLSGPCYLLPNKLACMTISYSDWSDKLDLKSIPYICGKSWQHPSFRQMKIVNCETLEGVFNYRGSLEGLEDLRILSCVCLKAPQLTGWQLGALRHLEVMCYDLKALVDIVRQLRSLEMLVIHNCNNHGCPRIRQQIEFRESFDTLGLLSVVRQVNLPVSGQWKWVISRCGGAGWSTNEGTP